MFKCNNCKNEGKVFPLSQDQFFYDEDPSEWNEFINKECKLPDNPARVCTVFMCSKCDEVIAVMTSDDD